MKCEKLLLATLAKKHPVIFSATKDAKTKKLKDLAWGAIEGDFHLDVNVRHRTLDSLKSCMHNLIQKAKKDDAKYRQRLRQTGGGGPPEPLDDVSRSIKEAMPQIFAPLDVDDDDGDNAFDISASKC